MAKADKIPHLHLGQKLNKALSLILTERFHEMISCEEEASNESSPEAVHSMRISVRRIQAVLKTFRGAFPAKKFKIEYANIQLLKNVLGEVRNYDVFIKKLEKFLIGSAHTDNLSLYMMITKLKLTREKKIMQLKEVVNELNDDDYTKKFKQFITSGL